jgi:uncharacterized protein (TIGR02246 family)
LFLLVASLPACAPGSDVSGDLAAIDALHAADVAAVLAGDTDALLNLWSDSPMALPPEGAILEGREAIAAMLDPGGGEAGRLWETVEYTQDFSEVQVLGGYGWDLGTVTTRLVHKTRGTEVTLRGKLLRILVRTADGEWRVHRSIWSTEPPEVSEGESS